MRIYSTKLGRSVAKTVALTLVVIAALSLSLMGLSFLEPIQPTATTTAIRSLPQPAQMTATMRAVESAATQIVATWEASMVLTQSASR